MMNGTGPNMELNVMNSLLGNKAEELGKNAGSKANSNLSDSEKSKFAKVSRGFEAMFMNMMLKEMKGSLKEEENPEFGGPLQEYTDMLFTEQISNNGTGVGIAEKVYKFLTGEDLPASRIINPTKDLNLIKQDVNSIPEQSKTESLKNTEPVTGNFLENVKDRIEVYSDIISQASQKFGVPEEMIKAVITTESAGHNHAKSKVGAKGLMQLMDGTARDLGVTDSFDPAQNIYGGTLYLRKMIDKFGHNDLALAAYNAGPGNVEKYGGVPPFRETESYIKKVNKYINKFQAEGKSKTGISL